jgi:hypothetical protein
VFPSCECFVCQFCSQFRFTTLYNDHRRAGIDRIRSTAFAPASC